MGSRKRGEGGYFKMNTAELAKSGKFVVTAEVGPPKGVDIQEMLDSAEMMNQRSLNNS